MKKLILIFCLFFSIIFVTNALPIPALALWYDFFIFLIPFIVSVFSFVFFYFKKYLNKINLFLFIILLLLYFIHYILYKNFIYNYLEIFFIFIICLFFILWFKLKYFLYFSFLFNIFIFFLLFNIDLKLYNLTNIKNNIFSEISQKYIITWYKLEHNYLSIDITDENTMESTYLVVENSKLDKNYIFENNWYYVVTWWNEIFWEKIVNLSKKYIK